MANLLNYKETIIHSGDLVSVHHKIKEGDKERIQIFEGVVISIRGMGVNKSFTVRRIAAGDIGVERIWPVICPSIVKIEVKKRGSVRRAKLYYLRRRVGKKANRVEALKTDPKAKKNAEKKPRQPRRKSSPKKPAK